LNQIDKSTSTTRKETDDIVAGLEGFCAYADRDLEITDMPG